LNAETLSSQYNSIISAAEEARDPAEMKKIAEEYASTFNSYSEMMQDGLIKTMMDNGHLSQDNALIAYASSYGDVLAPYIRDFNDATTDSARESAEQILL
jgi:hypothetical protein